MNCLQKEFIQNKGNVLLPCVFFILIIVTSISFVYINSSIKGFDKNNNETLARVFADNRFNEVSYDKNYTFSNCTVDLNDQTYSYHYRYNSYYKVGNSDDNYYRIQYFEFDSNKNIILLEREVYSE